MCFIGLVLNDREGIGGRNINNILQEKVIQGWLESGYSGEQNRGND